MNGHQKQREASRRMIETALFALMKEMEFSQITVCQIAERADVARRTFYRLYCGKEDVIRQYFAGLCGAYQDSCQKLEYYDLRQIAEDYFGFWYRHRELLLLLDRCGMDKMLYYEMNRVSMQIVKARMENKVLKERPDLAYFADYSVGGFVNLLHRWVQSGMQETASEYARKVSNALLEFSAINAP